MLILGSLFAGLVFTQTPPAVLILALLVAWFGSINFGALFQQASRRQRTGTNKLYQMFFL